MALQNDKLYHYYSPRKLMMILPVVKPIWKRSFSQFSLAHPNTPADLLQLIALKLHYSYSMSSRISQYIGLLKMQNTLRWRHNGCDSVSNHQPHDCLLNCLFKYRSKKTSKLCVTGLCAQMASNTENVSIWWRHHEMIAVIQFNIAIGFNINGHAVLSEHSEINNI